MRNQHLPDPLENLDFHINRTDACRKLSARILSGEYSPSPSQRILSEKAKGLCRQIVIPAPEDALVLQCLSDALYAEIKGKAPTSKAFFEPEDHSFSGEKDGNGYGTFWSWMNFQKALFNFSANRPFVVVTDVANYYDSISYSHLRNIISGISGVQECVLDMLIYVLSELLWQPDYMPRIEVGLPQIDLDAPRLLAHCFLYELDSYLDSTPTGDFARYMDDIDVGVDSIPEAKQVIRNIDLVLQTRQLRLNSGKTLILSRQEADRHFRISENIRLDAIEESISNTKSQNASQAANRIAIQKLIVGGLRSKKFDGGNGDKILKRLIGMAGRIDAKIALPALRSILRLRPSMRSSVFKYLSKSKVTLPRAKMLLSLIRSGLLVDDVGYTEMISRLLETTTPRNGKLHTVLTEIVESIADSGFFGFHAALWGMTKYSDNAAILDFLQTRRDVWVPDRRLGRLVGSLYPLFLSTTEWDTFLRLVAGSRNSGARDAFLFQSGLQKNPTKLKATLPILQASNSSKLTGITQSKFLCLLSALQNTTLTPAAKKKLLTEHKAAWSDGYYRALAKRCGSGTLP